MMNSQKAEFIRCLVFGVWYLVIGKTLRMSYQDDIQLNTKHSRKQVVFQLFTRLSIFNLQYSIFLIRVGNARSKAASY
ncbi:hypothetical protein D1AOALGA4SA_11102 [Olavius algarvensis Delta 1 endosymbiont]|nr:hypothetical protein D1AOALGA4SA_11102 [Olavius algarvensis Delta 1 endosymbiont]